MASEAVMAAIDTDLVRIRLLMQTILEP
jgi:hypothetical protein